MKNDNIFVVTAIKLNHVKKDLRSKKTQGWFKTFKEARQYILTNTDDMFEGGKYEHAVIETTESGGLMNAIDETWYEALYSYFDWDLYQIETCAKPKALSKTFGFAMVKK